MHTRQWKLASTITDAELQAAADARWAHQTRKGFRNLNPDLWWISLVGERAVARELGAYIDVGFNPEFRDGGADFYGSSGKAYDVKTVTEASVKWGLLVVAHKPIADVVILALYQPPNDAIPLGWATRDQIVAVPPRCWPRYVLNHVLPLEQITPWENLYK